MLLPQEASAVLEKPNPALSELAAGEQEPLRDRSRPLNPIARSRILLVDDDEDELFLTRKTLEKQECEVVCARSVTEALKQIATQSFDVLLTDLHMPEAGDGFAVVTAMRHSQPQALTLVASDYPDVQRAMNAILLQADEILVKPFDVKQLAALVDRRRSTPHPAPPVKEAVAEILERNLAILEKHWLARVEQIQELAAIPLTAKERAAYLPDMMKSITARLWNTRDLEGIDRPSPTAAAHGEGRYRQGYTAPMIVQESRLLQVTIFETIQLNFATVDFTVVLPDIMIIADEVDSQLEQTIASFLAMQKEKGTAASA